MAKHYDNKPAVYKVEYKHPTVDGIFAVSGDMETMKESEIVGMEPRDVARILVERHIKGYGPIDSDIEEIRLVRYRWFSTRKGTKAKSLEEEIIARFEPNDFDPLPEGAQPAS